ncbi:uncharacterized protein EDB93DRAFT_1327639 [Suillus bovinus]|uniref:uncharacterized protein n=1 Tax=Suillus bovinus TaxID=48563 RepID=UPI001B86B418|nr:uncharacterized protein EDB93DRAFT_1327639 [Suillus bovinus]KAG2151579.1 hypothetical protein EDB93DRAFT_1327639 [Suillus bovinus]
MYMRPPYAVKTLPSSRGKFLGSLTNLAIQLSSRFRHRGNDEDSDEAIALSREALALCPVGHTGRSKSLNNLANQHSSRFNHGGNDEDLDEGLRLSHFTRKRWICARTGATTKTWMRLSYFSGKRWPCGSTSLNNLANRLSSRFDPKGHDEDLDEAITLYREALALRPVGHDEDLDEAIALYREALALRPVGHTDRSASLNNLARQLSSRFQQRGNDEDLDRAIVLDREALALCPAGQTDRSTSLNTLATQLSTRFHHRGSDEDLEQSITLFREALALCPVGDTSRSVSLNNLATQLSSRFRHRGNDEDSDEAIALHRQALALCPRSYRGDEEDLDEAIALHREALALCPVGHTNRSMPLNNSATLLSIRFDHRGNDDDLDEAIALHRTALALRPVGNDEDLDEAILLQREALALRAVGHIDRYTSLNNLANGLSSRFKHRGNDEDLDQAIALDREALALCPVGHTDRSTLLYYLATRLSTHFHHQHNREDLDESRENLHCALTLFTQHDPRQFHVHQLLAKVYLSFHRSYDADVGADTDSLNAAMHHFKVSADVASAGLLSRLRASLLWVRHADQQRHGTQLEAYVTSMQLLDAYMSTTASISCRRDIMKDFPSTLAVKAASCALRSSDVCRAVELLEQGRTIIWTQMTRLRTPLDSFQTRGDHAVTLMKNFRDLSSLLKKPPANYSEATPRVDIKAEESRYRRLVEDWDRAVEEIRKMVFRAHVGFRSSLDHFD